MQNELTYKVVVEDLDIPFRKMVYLMVKWAFATLPAAAIICMFIFAFVGILSIIGATMLPFSHTHIK